MVGKTKYQNAADRDRMRIMADIPCIPCMIDGKSGVPATVQHVTEAGRRADDEHQVTYKSCPWHHLGHVPATCRGSVRVAEARHGPSLATNKPAFERHYGEEEELVMIQDALIRMVQSSARRGEFLTPLRLRRLTEALHREIVLRRPPSTGEVYAL